MDCHNIYIHVICEKFSGPMATITYGWESLAYYKEWMVGNENEDILANFKGPALATGSRQSQFAKRCLDIFKDMAKTERDYASRLNRRYQLVKSFIKDKKRHQQLCNSIPPVLKMDELFFR